MMKKKWFFVKKVEYIALRDSKTLKIPVSINGKLLSGACFSDVEIRSE